MSSDDNCPHSSNKRFKPNSKVDGVYIIPNILNEEEITVLLKECKYLLDNRPSDYDVCDFGCALDLFENNSLQEDSKARINVHDYFNERWKGKSYLTEDEKECIRHLLLDKLPNSLRHLLTKESIISTEDYDLLLFNEHYISKSAESQVGFKWHTDANEQLMAFPSDKRPQYWSLWCPLVDVYEENGTLFVLEESPAVIEEDEIDEEIEGTPIIASKGSVVVFSSDIWHRSSDNKTSTPRDVFYAQYSYSPIKSVTGAILNVAIPTMRREITRGEHHNRI